MLDIHERRGKAVSVSVVFMVNFPDFDAAHAVAARSIMDFPKCPFDHFRLSLNCDSDGFWKFLLIVKSVLSLLFHRIHLNFTIRRTSLRRLCGHPIHNLELLGKKR